LDLDAAIEQLRANAPQMLSAARLGFDDVRVFGTPRRLVVSVTGLTPAQTDVQRTIKGPPAERAFDEQGQPTKAALGFAKAQEVDVAELRQREYDGKSYVVALKKEQGRSAADVLAQILPELVASLKFAKSMRWNASGASFSRPVRWLVALLGDQVLPCEYAAVRSGRVTRGIRPFGGLDITISAADDYFGTMKASHIMLGVEEREAHIGAEVAKLAASVGGRVPDDPALLREVANLVEWPTPLLGYFEEEYLQLPQEVLIAVMKKHQRYFPVMQDGKLLPYFIAVINGPFEHLAGIQHGNERVIRARYADAAFFYLADSRKKLEEFLPRLDTLVFQEQLGSVLDKSRRLKQLVPQLAEMVGASTAQRQVAERAAYLCKADLATQVVIELTSLQGIMGAKYAAQSGESPEVAQAIMEHYLPRGAGDELPESVSGMVLGLADRIDSLVGLFAVGLSPTGSSDPYALRRSALGLVEILCRREVSLSLSEAFRKAAGLLPVEASAGALSAVHDFVGQRLRGWLLDQGYRHDLVDAALAERGDNPAVALQTVRSLAAWVDQPEFTRLLTAYSRPSRIVRDYAEQFPLNPDMLSQGAERELYRALLAAQEQRAEVNDVDGLMAVLRPLAEPIDRFFEDVFVMVDEQPVRENRLALLQRIAALAKGIVDLTKVLGY
jgi:glycyl-tRNA synthetase